MCCVDGSAFSEHAFRECLKFKHPDDELLITHAVELRQTVYTAYAPPVVFASLNEQLTEQAKRLVQSYAKKCRDMGIKNVSSIVIQSVDEPPKAGTVSIATKNNVDLIVVGSRGLGAIKRFFLGSFSNYLVNHAPCNVMVVKHGEMEAKNQQEEIRMKTGADTAAFGVVNPVVD